MTEVTFGDPDPHRRRAFNSEEWQRLGIAKSEALGWWKDRIEPGDALRWRKAGVTTPVDAVRWKIAGVDPGTVRQWIDAGIDAGEAVVWAELGFDSIRARLHKRAGRSPVQAYGAERRAPDPRTSASSQVSTFGHARHGFMQAVTRGGPGQAGRHVVHSYMSRQWFDDEAIAWATLGFDAGDAIAWKELGLTPTEAQRQQTHGVSAMQAAKAWWKAGIPVDEVADWIGAGLTPEEAAEQRTRGVTVEQAAVLRSLRKNERPAD
jgi:hypothetical protein